MNRRLVSIICLFALLAAAVPILAGQDVRPNVLRPGVLSSAIKSEASAQKAPSGGGTCFVTIDGTRTNAGRPGGIANRVPFMKFDYEVISPRDSASGQASGKRQHKPIRIVKEWDASTPLLFQALVTNEQIKTAKFEFAKADQRTGELAVYHTITLTNASVAGIRQFNGDADQPQSAKHNAAVDTMELEEISFTFQKIDVTNQTGKTSATDEFSNR